MGYQKTQVSIDPNVKRRLRPYLEKEELSFSAFVRREMRITAERHESQTTPPEGPEAA